VGTHVFLELGDLSGEDVDARNRSGQGGLRVAGRSRMLLLILRSTRRRPRRVADRCTPATRVRVDGGTKPLTRMCGIIPLAGAASPSRSANPYIRRYTLAFRAPSGSARKVNAVFDGRRERDRQRDCFVAPLLAMTRLIWSLRAQRSNLVEAVIPRPLLPLLPLLPLSLRLLDERAGGGW
jgi:hypothetical protein